MIHQVNIVSMAKAITKQQVQETQSGQVRMIDIRSVEEYEKLHIPEARNIPAENLAQELPAFKEDDTIICICNYGKERSQEAAELLANAGFKNTFYLEGGTMGWNDQNSRSSKGKM
jgi:rhodanese-related sulfurtransferase